MLAEGTRPLKEFLDGLAGEAPKPVRLSEPRHWLVVLGWGLQLD